MMKINKSERGQSLVELAISLVVLLYLLSGVVEFGIAFFQFIQLRDAAQEGALYGSIHPPVTAGDAFEVAIISRVRNASSSPINLAVTTGSKKVDVYVYTEDGNGDGHTNCVGDGLRVVVSFKHQIFMPFIPALIGSSTIPLTGSVTDTILHSDSTSCP